MTAPEPLRGVALVDAVMAKRRAEGEALTGATADALANEAFELSPALRRWLEHDGEMFTLGTPQALGELLAAELDEEWAAMFAPLGKYLTGPCVLFEGWGADSRRFLYLGSKDAHGEYTVFTIDTDDVPFACVNGPVDVWLAQHAGFLGEEDVYGAVPAEYEAVRAEHAARTFGGFVAFQDFQFTKDLDGNDGEFAFDDEGADDEVGDDGDDDAKDD